MDAASSGRDLKARSLSREDTKGGNPEGVGFAEQVGGQSASADASGTSHVKREEHKDEEAATPGLFSTIKRSLGMGSDAGDVKQNSDGGHGVSGSGTSGLRAGQQQSNSQSQSQSRGLHTSGPVEPSQQSDHVRRQTLGTGKDKPSSLDYMRDVLRDNNRRTRPHNLSDRGRQTAPADAITPNPLFDADKTVAPPRRHPRSDAIRATAEIHEGHDGVGKPSGEWSVAGHASSEYKNVSVQEDPYEVPHDDTDAATKEDSREKKLRYGGLRTKPDLA
ncbi:hypothetical protein SCHPADRAFT_909953 [Schizopora paradoxa]|uniref:Uncharacterized protein n=1 Tax=Schizopora paradoxa TaxID=27342 RepID=A0A0H2R545_9AGAM|nr:hypothetical protein SCHPADRAFT_909953 [Schizopora paradoxa]